MSSFAILSVMSKVALEQYCAMARLVPKNQAKQKPADYTLQLISPKEMKSSEFQKKILQAKNANEFLRKNSTEPFAFNWSGYVFYDLLCCLKEIENIDLMTDALVNEDGSEQSWVFGTDLKLKYLKKLDPANFSESKMKFEYQHLDEQRRNGLPDHSPSDDFPEAGKALMDGVRIIYELFNLVNEQTVVLVQVV